MAPPLSETALARPQDMPNNQTHGDAAAVVSTTPTQSPCRLERDSRTKTWANDIGRSSVFGPMVCRGPLSSQSAFPNKTMTLARRLTTDTTMKTTATGSTTPFPSTIKQRVLLALTVPLVPLALTVFSGVATMRHHNSAFHLEASASAMPQPMDLLVSLWLAFTFVQVRVLTLGALESVARLALPLTFRLIPFRVQHFATSLFKLLYFMAMAVIGYSIARDEPWLPPSLGGSGTISATFSEPTRPPSTALRLYMLVQLAYLAHNLIFVVWYKPVDDETMDFVIHDLTGMLLVSSSYLVNYLGIAAAITFLNDTADVAHYLLVLATDSRRVPMIVPMLGVFCVGYGYPRLYVFPRDCLWAAMMETTQIDSNASTRYLYPTNAMLGLLFGLQIYWFDMLVRKGLRVLRGTPRSSIKYAEAPQAQSERQ